LESTKTFGFVRKEKILEKLFLSKLFWLILMIFLFGYPIYKSLNRTMPKPLPKFGNIKNFILTDQHGNEFNSNKLDGQVSIASFAFTSCPTTCPAIMKKMQKIQKRVRGLGTKISLLTFSVDPQYDTPTVLDKYAKKLHANPYIWSFLTGDKENVKNIIVKNFLLPMGDKEAIQKKVNSGEVTIFDITHSGRVVLIDQNKEIRGYYSLEKNSINKLMIDTGLLVNNAFRNIK